MEAIDLIYILRFFPRFSSLFWHGNLKVCCKHFLAARTRMLPSLSSSMTSAGAIECMQWAQSTRPTLMNQLE